MALAGLTVLVVDDDQHIYGVIRDLLRFWGCGEVEVAADGEEGVEAFRRIRPDLVIMDMEMPRMNGYEASRAIKALNPEADIILLTGIPESRLAKRTLEAGLARLILPKPFDSDQLKMAVQETSTGRKSPARKQAGKGAVA